MSPVGSGGTPEERAARARADQSLLDAVLASANDLEQELGGADRVRIDDYLENLREVERRIGKREQTATDTRLQVPDAPTDIPKLYEDPVALMFDLQHLAFQTEATRVTTFMMSRELNLYGSGMGDGNVHSKDPISSPLVGGAGGKLAGGRHVQIAKSTPHPNLLLTVLGVAGIELAAIGNGTGTIPLA